MPDRRRLSLIVGLFVVLSLLVGSAALLTLGSRSGLLKSRYRLVTYFENVQGLLSGAPVRLAGKDVGTVEFVTFAALGEDVPPVRVILQVDEDVQQRIRSDSVAGIGTVGLLGDKYVEISMGTLEGRILGNGQELASVSPVDMEVAIVRGIQAIDNVASLAANLNRVVQEFGEAMGGRRIAEATEALGELVNEIKQGEGLLNSLIYDSYEGSGVTSIETSLATLEDLLNEVAHGDGVLHTLIYESAGEQDVVAEAMEAGARLNAILGKVDDGDGTLGLLVNDPSLYHEMKALLGGAQRSLVVRSLIRLSGDQDQ